MVKTLIWAYLVASVVLANDNCNTDIVAIIQRRTEDIYYYQATSDATDCQHACNQVNETFLVAEQQCVHNSNFFKGRL